MPILTGKLVRGTGAALVTSIRFWRPGPGTDGEDGVSCADAFLVSTGEDGTFTTPITSGTWLMTWPKRPGGTPITRIAIIINETDTDVSLLDAMARVYLPDYSSTIRTFQTIAEMLAADPLKWAEGRTMNSYGTDGIRSGWMRVLKTAPSAAGLVGNGDSILVTDDGAAFVVRQWVAA